MKVHDRVMIYHDPITVSDPEEAATIVTTPRKRNVRRDYGTDEKGRPLYRAIVEFHDGVRCYRTFSEKIE